jgi:hypothetical protein
MKEETPLGNITRILPAQQKALKKLGIEFDREKVFAGILNSYQQ